MIEAIPFEQYERQRSKSPRLERVSTTAIMEAAYEPIRWIVPGYLPEGFGVLAGRQKLGKTWLAMDWSIAVASGGTAMGGIDVEQGDVLYVDLENGPRRIQRRLAMLYPSPKSRPDLSRLAWATEAPNLDKGMIDALEDWRRSVANPRLVVVDVLQRVKPIGNAARNSYENDYSAWAPLQKWAMQHGIGVLGLHHTRKGGADDPLEALSGSNGLSACADTTLVLDRDSSGITLYVRGRDVDEKESALVFSAGLWTLTGEASEVRRTTERQKIIDALIGAKDSMTPLELADATGMPRGNVRQMCLRMARDNEIVRSQRGHYAHPATAALLSQRSQCHYQDEVTDE